MTTAMVFPGQGSQSVGMQAALAERYAVVRDTYAEASEVLGYDLWRVVQDGPEERLGSTEVTQPAMLTAGVATFRAWREEGGAVPSAMAGHSLGEYSALVCAGAIRFPDAVHLVQRRGQYMQNACPPDESAMAAVLGLDDEAVLDICVNASTIGTAEAVNFNSPGQVVVAGNRLAVQTVIDLAKDAGARRALKLPVSVPSHSSLMMGAGEKLAELLADTIIETPALPVISSAVVRPYDDGADIRALLKRQVHSPVQWVRTVQVLIADGARRIIECGPGKVLAGLSKRIDRSVSVSCIDTPEALAKALEEQA